ncbi:PAS domain S-box protein [Argonema antarcticum]|uniref:PAS domain S-box protein n=1 Tax=Argonema antarcticum TaxID=2942763 RepID=UPI0020116901|nr:PAS domain S-box protein [Argonema antarcticum]MCL1471916.1 PAS domain S-box protein [Argonema antarcticum A004/B2]
MILKQVNDFKANILVVDDNAEDLKLLMSMLSSKGYRVRVAPNGKLALKSVKSSPPDLILLDIMMPGIDGYEVCQHLKENFQTRDIPIIFFSALNQVVNKVKAFAIGGVDYIIKPFHEEEVLARVENQLRLQSLQKQLAEQNAQLQQEIRYRSCAEEALRLWADKLREQNIILAKIAKNKALNQGDIKPAVQEITAATALNLAVERASVWLYDETKTKLKCVDLFEQSINQHSEGFELAIGDYPAYFEALEQDEPIAAADAHADPRTKEFSESYLTPLGIASMLDIPIRLGGETVGVLCLEHIGSVRDWTPEDQNFSRSIADLISLALEARERQRAEAGRRSSEAKLASAFRSSPDPIGLVTFPQGRYIEVNDSFCNFFGYDRAQTIGRTVRDLNIWVNLEERNKIVQSVQEKRAIRNCEVDVRTASGEIKTVLFSAELIEIDGQECLLGTKKDITDRKKADVALKSATERLQYLLTSNPAIIYSCNAGEDFGTTFISSNVKAMLGYEAREFLEDSSFWSYHIHPEDVHRIFIGLANLLSQRSYSCEYRFLHKDGTYRWVYDQRRLVRDKAGNHVECIGYWVDISDRKQAEFALRESQRRYQTLAEASPVCIFNTDADGNCLYVNQRWSEMTGLCLEMAAGEGWTSNLHPDDCDRVFTEWAFAVEARVEFKSEYRFQRPDGTLVWVIGQALPEIGNDDEIKGYVGTITDISDRKRTEAALRESEERFGLAVSGTNDGIWDGDLRTDRVYFSPVWMKMLGYSEGELPYLISTWLDRVHPDDLPKALGEFQDHLEAKTPIYQNTHRIQRKDGQWLWVEAKAKCQRDSGGKAYRVTGTMADITQRKQVEEALQESAERERALAQVIQRMRQTLDIETIFAATTQELRQVIDCDRVVVYHFHPDWSGELVAESVGNEWNSLLEQQANYPKLAENAVEEQHCTVKALNSLDSPIWRDTYLQETQGGVYNEGASYLVVEDIYSANFTPCYLELLERFQARAYIIVPIFSGNKLWGLLATYQNSAPRQWKTTEINVLVQIGNQLGVALQQAELLEQTQKQSQALQKSALAADAANRAKSEFLANMSHELRTPLNVILGFTQVMTRDTSLSSQQQENLVIINRAGEHLLELINDILEMSKIEAGQTTLNENSFDLIYLLDSLEKMLRFKAESKGLQLRFESASDLPQYVQSDENKLRQVLINLLGNAIKFTEKGTVALRVKRGLKTGEKSINNQSLYFEIEDTGPGIKPEELDLLFKAFGQTETGRKSQQGTGLGLPISRKYVQLMGGDIKVSSTPGKVTLFTFDIQIKLTDAAKIKTRQSKCKVIGLAPNQPEYRILVVDDARESRLLLVRLFTLIGFSVRVAENGREGVSAWSSWLPHLILMDMRMPVMDGYEATKQIKAHPLGKTTKIVALTASAFDEQRQMILSIGCDDFVGKPFREEVLLGKISQHLGVEYIYEQEDLIANAMQQTDFLPEADLVSLLSEMSAEWIAQLYHAAVQCSDELILDLLEQIPPEKSTLVDAITDLANNFQFEKIMQLTQQGTK